jgi:predicted nucleic acid-binding Zn ribbon protein|tara:strand:+ start:489 stop:764 length:276 start_codon:yes stop_codon:yes gene_type:complete
MQKLKAAINNLLKAAGLDAGVAQNKALLVWDDVVGAKVSENTTPEKVEAGTLYIKASNPTWRQELVFKKEDILKKLNKKLGEKTIKEIKFI